MRAADARVGCLMEGLEPRELLSTFTVTTIQDAGAGSLRQAILDANAAAGADVIEFDATLSGQTISLLYGELTITDDLTINGPGSGQLTLDAATSSRIFCNEADATISGLTLTRGSTGGDGGAISSGMACSLTLRDVSILDCEAQYSGGGIDVQESGRLLLDDVRMAGCVASMGNGGGICAGPGGSVDIVGAGAEIRNGWGERGGAIYLHASTLRAERLTILENSALSGAGICAVAQSRITLSDGSLLRNAADWGGAAHLSEGSSLKMTSVSVSENAGAFAGGGVVAQDGARVTVSDSLFDCNTSMYGGALHAGDGATITLTGSTLSRNHATEDGGALYVGFAPLAITGSLISENIAGGCGGGLGIVFGAEAVLIEGTTIESNTAALDGGGLMLSGDPDSSAELRSTVITGNTAGERGGGAAISCHTLLIDGCTVSSNTASQDSGGGLHIADATATIRDTTIEWNSARAGGGVTCTSGVLTVVYSTIESNRAQADGGGVYVTGSGVLRLGGSTVNGNSADLFGGGVALEGGIASVVCSAIVGNGARDGGGVSATAETHIENSTIAGNSARSTGGGIGAYANASVHVVSSTIVHNFAAGFYINDHNESGGGIFNQSALVRLQSTILALNSDGVGEPNENDFYGLPLDGQSSFNLIGHAGTAGGLIDGQSGNIVGVDPLLDAAGDYGGPTLTYPLLPDSPAINAGLNPLGLTTDQRGPRFSRESGVPDIGAFEVQSLALVVDNAGDLFDGHYEPGKLSLREAIALANVNPGPDAIGFDASLKGATITLGGTELAITDSVSIAGPGAALLVIDAAGASRHFSIDDGINVFPPPVTVSISGIHLRNGWVPGNGGAIYNREMLSLDRVRLSGNTTGHDGGAVASLAGSLRVTDSTFTGNTARVGGALVISGEFATIDRCLIYQNSAGSAGAIAVTDAALTIRNSTISGNSAGGILVVGPTTTARVLNSTICGNGGLYAGGIHIDGAVVILLSTIVASNTAGGLPSDIDNGAVTGSNNLIGEARTSGGLTDGVDGNIVGADPRLAALADNGGPTLTHALLPGSPAIDAGSNPHNLATDQRGKPRLRGPAPDIGAFESNVRPTIGGIDPAAPHIVQGSTLLLRAIDAADSDGPLAAVRYWADLDGDGEADTLLGESSKAGDGFAFTVPGTISRTFPLRGVTFIARSVDDEGALSLPVTLDVGVLYSLRPGDDSTPRAGSTADDELWTCIVNQAGDVVVFECNGACAHHLGLAAGAPAAVGDAIIYTDPKDGLVYAAYPSALGLILARRDAGGAWSFRNLSTEAGIDVPDGPARALTHLVSTRASGRVVVLAGIDAAGRIVGLRQDGSSTGGAFDWSFIDISADLDSQGMATPAFADLISYVTPWNAWTLAGIDGAGNIHGVWVAPASFDTWRVDNLSRITGAPPISGQLTVTQTAWHAINLGGVNDDGHLVVTWWVPSFEGKWVTSDLTAISGGEPLAAGRATGFVTPWGAINYAGLNGAGEVAAYWWTPTTNRWLVSPLTAAFPDTTDRPTGNLTSHVSAAGTMSLLGATDERDVTRLWWTPNDDGRWKLTDLTECCARA